ncbi:glucose-6- phosphate 1-epimerase [Acrasis kona]|uniref:glucose-6-phosphate 1-epimerase n=1 Tax=Acrasis kona TaxID=1008807 RepID=A0AAW2Z2V0_9EUKA
MSISEDSTAVTLTHQCGDTLKVLLYGATIISWVSGRERLFLSSKAALDGSKAVRGGIPLVFPVFGKSNAGPTKELPQHGFARTSTWRLLSHKADSESTQVKLELSNDLISQDAHKLWPYAFNLIDLKANSFVTSMEVQNKDKEPFDFNFLFHTYFAVNNISTVSVRGLNGAQYVDKKRDAANFEETEKDVKISNETDRVYKSPSGPTQIVDEDCTVDVQRDNLNDVVVWNPWENAAKNMGDFGPEDGWKKMLCIEAGSVSNWQNLGPGESWKGVQTVIRSML